MTQQKAIVHHTTKELLTTFDVTATGRCFNERGNYLTEIIKEVKLRLDEKDPEVLKEADYFDINAGGKDNRWDPNTQRIAVFYVKGGSEGYYVHVEAFYEGTRKLIFLAKTLREGEAGITWAEKMVCALSRILEV